MATASFHVPGLQGPRDVGDLAATLTGLSGVAGFNLDPQSHSAAVEYDVDYTNSAMIEAAISGAGYPVKEAGR